MSDFNIQLIRASVAGTTRKSLKSFECFFFPLPLINPTSFFFCPEKKKKKNVLNFWVFPTAFCLKWTTCWRFSSRPELLCYGNVKESLNLYTIIVLVRQTKY